MKILIRKSVYDSIMKSLYLQRFGYPGHYRYRYPDTGRNDGGSRNNDIEEKTSRLIDTTNNVDSITSHKEGLPATPQNASSQTAQKYISLDNTKSQYVIKKLNKIKTENIQPREFLNKLKIAFGLRESHDSVYVTKKMGSKNITLRISNHNANGDYVRKNESVTSIVITLSESNFKNFSKKNIVEYVYKPENLSKEVKDGIIKGIIDWINTDEYTDNHANSINKSY